MGLEKMGGWTRIPPGDCMVLEKMGGWTRITPGEYMVLEKTTPGDGRLDENNAW